MDVGEWREIITLEKFYSEERWWRKWMLKMTTLINDSNTQLYEVRGQTCKLFLGPFKTKTSDLLKDNNTIRIPCL